MYVLTLVLLVHFRGSLAELGSWGYPGVLLFGLVGGVGAAVGELTGYLLGTRSHAVVHKGRLFRRILRLIRPLNGAGIITLAILPFPFMGVGFWAGRVRYPMRHFLFFVTTGKVVKLTGLALGAYHTLPWLLQP